MRNQASRAFEHLTQAFSSFVTDFNFVFEAIVIGQVYRNKTWMVMQTVEEVLCTFWLNIVASYVNMNYSLIRMLKTVGYIFESNVAYVILTNVYL